MRTPATVNSPGARPGLEVARDLAQRADDVLQRVAERHRLAERHEMALGVGALDDAGGIEQHVEVRQLVAVGRRVDGGVGEHPRVVRRGRSRSGSRRTYGVGARIGVVEGVHARLGEHDQVDRVGDPASQREVAVRQVVGLHLGVGELAVLVVALDERDVQRADDMRLGAGDGRDDDDRRDRPRSRPGSDVGARRRAARASRSATNALSATARKVTNVTPPTLATARAGREVVERVADLTPREAAERPAGDDRVGAHPDRGGQPRVRDAGARAATRSSAPAAAQYAATAALNGTIATVPKYQIHEQSVA